MIKALIGGFYVCMERIQKFNQIGYDIEYERFYYENVNRYYHSLRSLGIEYDSMNC